MLFWDDLMLEDHLVQHTTANFWQKPVIGWWVSAKPRGDPFKCQYAWVTFMATMNRLFQNFGWRNLCHSWTKVSQSAKWSPKNLKKMFGKMRFYEKIGCGFGCRGRRMWKTMGRSWNKIIKSKNNKLAKNTILRKVSIHFWLCTTSPTQPGLPSPV